LNFSRCLQRPNIFHVQTSQNSDNFTTTDTKLLIIYNIKQTLNKNHLTTTATFLGSLDGLRIVCTLILIYIKFRSKFCVHDTLNRVELLRSKFKRLTQKSRFRLTENGLGLKVDIEDIVCRNSHLLTNTSLCV